MIRILLMRKNDDHDDYNKNDIKEKNMMIRMMMARMILMRKNDDHDDDGKNDIKDKKMIAMMMTKMILKRKW